MGILFRADSGNYTDRDFEAVLSRLDLSGKAVLVYSRLLSFGRLTGEDAVKSMVLGLKRRIGAGGTLCIPAYSFSGYNSEVYDPANSRCIVGQLGETARKMRGFKRTFHPVYSHAVWGRHSKYLLSQNPHSSFGDDSFFELFSKIEGSCVLFLGTTLSTATIVHRYDQHCAAKGRFLKNFTAKCLTDGKVSEMQFDSFVKDYEYYNGRVNCLAPLEVLADDLGIIQRERFANDWIHMVSEKNFRDIYSMFLMNGMTDKLIGSVADFQEYYHKNNFRYYMDRISKKDLSLFKKLLKLK
ncbi:MAG: AAC(3) family N-acetyltransferase [Victivallales bacterium]